MGFDQTCFFSGHRTLPADPLLLPALEEAVRRASRAGCRRFLCGGALGFDYEKRKIMRSEFQEISAQNNKPRNHFA